MAYGTFIYLSPMVSSCGDVAFSFGPIFHSGMVDGFRQQKTPSPRRHDARATVRRRIWSLAAQSPGPSVHRKKLKMH